MKGLPDLVLAAATGLGLPPDELVPLGGETGQVYAVSGQILRIVSSITIDAEEAAAARASAVVPVPQVLARFDHELGSALLMTRMPGAPAWQPGEYDPVRARRRGLACGRAQLSLATVAAPPQLPSVRTGKTETEEMDVLVHLDLHPLNILLGEDDEVTAVLDWANAAAGPAEYDRARSAAILYLDPSTRPLRYDPSWRAFAAGWTEAAQLDDVPPQSIAWACRYMLNDLTGRHPAESLRPVLEALRAAESSNLASDKAPLVPGNP